MKSLYLGWGNLASLASRRPPSVTLNLLLFTVRIEITDRHSDHLLGSFIFDVFEKLT